MVNVLKSPRKDDLGAQSRTRHNGGAIGVAERAWHGAIKYNETEANRLGVPYVSSKEWLADVFHSPGKRAVQYLDELFPFTKWILSYNLQWFIGDLIAGFTVGLVVVPQSLSYASVATLPLEYGLYSSFVGVVIYVLFATSKDVTIGPVAVMSLQTANVIRQVMKDHPGLYTAPEIASALAFICGVITLGIGLLRLGWIVEFIPAPAVSGFMSGSAFTIAAGQVPKLMGITVTTNGVPTYKVVVNTLKGLPRTKVDAAFGLGSLVFLYAVRSICNRLPRRYPKLTRTCFFISVFRTAFIVIVMTGAVYGWLKDYNPKKYPISLIKTVPAGFKHVGQPKLTTQLFSDMAGEIPVSVIVLLLEHIAISKSFGRLNNYKIRPNQELIAIGVTNMVGPTFGAYPATGSFSRTAIKAKSGVRTPLAGWVTAIVVVVALYGVTGAFYWIPQAVLAAVIIHAVGDLFTPPAVLYRFWLVSPFEFFIWVAAVLVSVFASLEIGVYVSVAASAALLLIRIAHPRGRWLGIVRIHYGDSKRPNDSEIAHRDVFVPLDIKDGLRDPSVKVDAPPPGILIYRFEEAFTYPNASHLTDVFLDKVKKETRPNSVSIYKRRGDRPWNDPGPINPAFHTFAKVISCGLLKRRLDQKMEDEYNEENRDDNRPKLRAIIFDFSSVSNVDTTSVQCLADVRQSVERYVGDRVDFYFANITSPWIRRGLLAAGFGTGVTKSHFTEVAQVVQHYDRIHDPILREDAHLRAQDAKYESDNAIDVAKVLPVQGSDDLEGNGGDASSIEKGSDSRESQESSRNNRALPSGSNNDSQVSVPIIWNHDLTPFFHLDLSAALAAATNREFVYGK